MPYPEIIIKLNTLREYLNNLRAYVLLDTDILLKNKEKILAMERLFQLSVDEAIDINAYVAYQITDTVPESYKSSFHTLIDAAILDREFVEEISGSAKVRNQIIHDYEKLQKRDTIELIKKFFPLYEKYQDILAKKFISN